MRPCRSKICKHFLKNEIFGFNLGTFQKYNSECKNELTKKLGINNVMRLPKLTKVVLNMGLGEDASDGKKIKTSLK